MKAIKFSNKTRILITGNKNTGKSTLCNFMVDQLASKQSVCLIDLDIGKGRGLPGSISLYRCSPNKNP
jgi:polynucleotide 5'-kinase involved in rRNA processing